MFPQRERQGFDLAGVVLTQPSDSETCESTRSLRGFSPGELVGGRFRIVRRLGSGGMGDVYQAEDTAHSRRRSVALKTIRADIAGNRRSLVQFEREIEIGQTVTHPNVCRIYDLGFHHERGSSLSWTLFVTMELLEGPTLAERLREAGPMSTGEALPLLSQLGEALHAAHQANIVHRDFKPGNVMLVNGRGDTLTRAVVTDFGLAMEIPPESGTAPVAGPAGTPDYMSPEQVSGRRLDAASDIYALGVVAYQMTTGYLPFDGETSAVRMMKRVHEPPVPPSRRVEGFDPRWEAAILKCLEPDPANRFPTARAAVEALRPEAASLPAKPTRRGYVLAAVLAVLLALTGWSLSSGLISWLNPLPDEKRVAVLRFEEIGGTGDHAFCEGLMETLSSKLAQLEQFQGTLSVVPASEVRGEKVTSAKEARREFNANLVIVGSVQRTSEGLRLIVNVVDTKTLKLARSQEIFIPYANPVAMQNGVITTVANLLEIQLHPEARQRLSEGDTAVPGAYEYYLQGAGYLRSGRNGVDLAILLFERALKLDAKYGLAAAGLGEAYAMKYRITKDPRWMDEAWKHCRRALELNPRSVQSHITMAVLKSFTGRYEEAIEEANAALSIDPANDQAHTELARALGASKRPREAEAVLKKAVELRPGNWNNFAMLGRFYIRHSRYLEAERAYLRVIDLAPDNPTGYTNLGSIYHLSGRKQEAERMFRRSLEVRPTPEAAANLATVYFFQGRYADAVPILEKLTADGSRNYIIWGNLGDAYRWTTGLAARAPEAYRKAIELANKTLSVNPRDAQALSSLALYRAKVGEAGAAMSILNRALKTASGDHNVVFTAALVNAIAGRSEQALRYLAMAVEGGYSRNEIAMEPELEALRNLTGYRKLMEPKGKEP